MIPKQLYPQAPWPLADVERHPCMPFLIADAKRPSIKPARKNQLSALMAVLIDVSKRPEHYADPLPLGEAFDTTPSMPQSGYDLGALVSELSALQLFRAVHRDGGTVLVSAERAREDAAEAIFNPKTETLTTRVPAELAKKARERAAEMKLPMSAFIHKLLYDALDPV